MDQVASPSHAVMCWHTAALLGDPYIYCSPISDAGQTENTGGDQQANKQQHI